jgi:hypothetical protein
MTLKLALDGRTRALALRKADRILVKPAAHLTDVVLPVKGSLDAGLLMVLHRGVSVERLAGKSGWSPSEVMVQVFRIVKRARLGIERRGGELFLLYPETGMSSSSQGEELREAVKRYRTSDHPNVVIMGGSEKLDRISLSA